MTQSALTAQTAQTARTAATAPATPWAVGAGLFHGEIALVGRLRHHEQDLPVIALACVNCHDPARSQGAVPIQGGVLRRPLPRLGGPAVAYDTAAFCRLLRTGVAANQVLVDGLMPRYDMAESDCVALWAYLLQPHPVATRPPPAPPPPARR